MLEAYIINMSEDGISYIVTGIVIVAVIVAIVFLTIRHNQPIFPPVPHITPAVTPSSNSTNLHRGSSTPSSTSNIYKIPPTLSSTPISKKVTPTEGSSVVSPTQP